MWSMLCVSSAWVCTSGFRGVRGREVTWLARLQVAVAVGAWWSGQGELGMGMALVLGRDGRALGVQGDAVGTVGDQG